MRFSIPTPTISVVEIGPFSVHIYALCIMSGVALAIWLGNKRFLAAYPDARGIVSDVAIVAVPSWRLRWPPLSRDVPPQRDSSAPMVAQKIFLKSGKAV